jgi:predicted Zn-dependent protease with MMP-like domain
MTYWLTFIAVLIALLAPLALGWIFNRDAKKYLEDHPSGEPGSPIVRPDDWTPRFTQERFQQIIDAALDSIPLEAKDALRGVAVVPEDWPDEFLAAKYPGCLIFGVYVGADNLQWGSRRSAFPRVIKIFQVPIEMMSTNEQEAGERIRQTVLHEIAHHLGMGHERMGPLGL